MGSSPAALHVADHTVFTRRNAVPDAQPSQGQQIALSMHHVAAAEVVRTIERWVGDEVFELACGVKRGGAAEVLGVNLLGAVRCRDMA